MRLATTAKLCLDLAKSAGFTGPSMEPRRTSDVHIRAQFSGSLQKLAGAL